MPKRKSKPKSCHRVFSREFKIGIVCRILAGENVSALARELRMTRKDLYAWRDRFQAGGPEALRGRGRPRKVLPTRKELRPKSSHHYPPNRHRAVPHTICSRASRHLRWLTQP
jgi:transposase-like protein